MVLAIDAEKHFKKANIPNKNYINKTLPVFVLSTSFVLVWIHASNNNTS